MNSVVIRRSAQVVGDQKVGGSPLGSRAMDLCGGNGSAAEGKGWAIGRNYGDYSYESGYKEAALLLRRTRPDALVCANDLMAIGVKDAAALLGINVPADIALVGHDGVALAAWDSHSITTIMPPPGAVSAALSEIIERSPSEPPQQRVIGCVVRWGRSTGEIPRRN